MIKFLIGVVVLAVAGAVVAFVIVVSDNRSKSAGDFKACAERIGLNRIDGTDSLGAAKDDLGNGSIELDRQAALRGGAQATILVPQDGDYTLVALTSEPETPGFIFQKITTQPGELAGLYLARTRDQDLNLRACVTGQEVAATVTTTG
jgi:hypothetical protein